MGGTSERARCPTGGGLSQQRSAFGETREVEGSRKPIHDRAQLPWRLRGITPFGVELGKVACGVQFEEARSLLARLRNGTLEAKPSLVVITPCLLEAAAYPNNLRKVHFLVRCFGQVLSFIEVRAGLLELVCAQLIFGELRQIARQKKSAASLAPNGYSPLNICQTPFFIAEF